jgi:hypothetical protein
MGAERRRHISYTREYMRDGDCPVIAPMRDLSQDSNKKVIIGGLGDLV